MQYPPLSVFGHADPVGNDDYNKALSGRRATAIYAVLLSAAEPDKAVNLWRQIAATENWGNAQYQTIQALTGLPAGSSRGEMFSAYFKALCPSSLQLASKDFLGQGADPSGTGDYQGCSEFNPILIFSSDKATRFEQAAKSKDSAGLAARNMANAPNLRVVVLLFRPGSSVSPGKWPCPAAVDGVAGCKQRFWSDGETRRSSRLPSDDREFSKSKDTFACRFYQRLTTSSPCERKVINFQIRLFDKLGQPIPNAPYQANEGVPLRGKADQTGTVVLSNVTVPSTCTISWRTPGDAHSDKAFEYSMSVFIDTDVSDSDQVRNEEVAQRQLHNLGFSMGDSLSDNIRFFQREFGAVETGEVKDIQDVLNQRHALLDPPSRYKAMEGPVLPPAPQQMAGPFPPDPLPEPDPIPAGEEF